MLNQPKIAILPRAAGVPNVHRVPRGFWGKWSYDAKRVFNETYATMRDNQPLFQHPKAESVPAAYWRTTAWNAAVVAAETR